MRKAYCPTCDMFTEARVSTKEEVFCVRGENVAVKSSVLVCDKCKQDIFDEELDEKNLELAYTAYRKNHSLLLPTEIREIREKYGLSQRSLGRLLEWGQVTVNRYENGAIQDTPHNDILEFISNPENMLGIYQKNNHVLTPSARRSLRSRIDDLIQREAEPHFRISLERYLVSGKVADEFSGYKEFDLTKMMNMILYISQSLAGVFKTKVNKLLWYMDFAHFKEFSVSISGSSYVHLTYGPIPNDYDLIIALMMNKKLLEKEEITFEKGVVGENLKASSTFDSTCFGESELRVMDFVLEYFRDSTCGQISEFSHEEKPYKSTDDNERISYELASELSLNLAQE